MPAAVDTRAFMPHRYVDKEQKMPINHSYKKVKQYYNIFDLDHHSMTCLQHTSVLSDAVWGTDCCHQLNSLSDDSSVKAKQADKTRADRYLSFYEGWITRERQQSLDVVLRGISRLSIVL